MDHFPVTTNKIGLIYYLFTLKQTNICIFLVKYANGTTIKLDGNKLTKLNEGAIKQVIDYFVANGQIKNFFSISESIDIFYSLFYISVMLASTLT